MLHKLYWLYFYHIVPALCKVGATFFLLNKDSLYKTASKASSQQEGRGTFSCEEEQRGTRRKKGTHIYEEEQRVMQRNIQLRGGTKGNKE